MSIELDQEQLHQGTNLMNNAGDGLARWLHRRSTWQQVVSSSRSAKATIDELDNEEARRDDVLACDRQEELDGENYTAYGSV